MQSTNRLCSFFDVGIFHETEPPRERQGSWDRFVFGGFCNGVNLIDQPRGDVLGRRRNIKLYIVIHPVSSIESKASTEGDVARPGDANPRFPSPRQDITRGLFVWHFPKTQPVNGLLPHPSIAVDFILWEKRHRAKATQKY